MAIAIVGSHDPARANAAGLSAASGRAAVLYGT